MLDAIYLSEKQKQIALAEYSRRRVVKSFGLMDSHYIGACGEFAIRELTQGFTEPDQYSPVDLWVLNPNRLAPNEPPDYWDPDYVGVQVKTITNPGAYLWLTDHQMQRDVYGWAYGYCPCLSPCTSCEDGTALHRPPAVMRNGTQLRRVADFLWIVYMPSAECVVPIGWLHYADRLGGSGPLAKDFISDKWRQERRGWKIAIEDLRGLLVLKDLYAWRFMYSIGEEFRRHV